MERRELIGMAGAIATLAVSTAALGQGQKAGAKSGGHQHHHGGAKTELLLDAVAECLNKGEVCIAHCIMLMGDGDKSVAGCARTVSETLALCEALRKVAAQGSPRAKDMARLARASCLDCEKECRRHEKKHAECAACAKACAACAKECEAFAA